MCSALDQTIPAPGLELVDLERSELFSINLVQVVRELVSETTHLTVELLGERDNAFPGTKHNRRSNPISES